MAEKGFGVKEINLIGASGTPTIESPNNLNLNAVNVAISTNVSIGGTLTVSGNLSIGGTITYEDVTNIDSVGLITARSGVSVTSGGIQVLAGTSRFNANIIGTATTAISVTAADESSDTSCNVLFSTAATGNVAPKTGTNLTFNSSNGTLTATTFSGSGASLTSIPAGQLTGTVADARISTLTASKLSGALPAISGANLTNLPAANLTGTLPAISGANLTNLPADTPTNTDIQVAYTVTANGSSAYRFGGNGIVSTEDNPDVYLIRGLKYRFINNSGGSHPFQIRQSSGGSAYSAGVTNNGASSGNIDFQVPYSAPSRLYYQCTSHGGMVGNLYIRGAGGQNDNVGVTTFSGAVNVTAAITADDFRTDSSSSTFYLTSANDWRFRTTSGSERVRITSTGNMKVGFVNNINPTTVFDVMASAINQDIVRFTGANYNRGLKISTAASGAINDALIKYDADSQNSAGQHAFLTDGTERLRIASDGVITGRGELRLTQGTSVVSNGSEIGSLMYLYPSNDNKNAKIVAIQNGGTSGADLAFYTRQQGDATNTDGGTEKLRITDSGRVGIMETNPQSPLQVKGGIRSAQTPGNGHIDLKHDGTNGSVTTSYGNFLFYNTNNSGSYIFHTTSSNSAKIEIKSDGKVAFNSGGTVNATYQFDYAPATGGIIVNANASFTGNATAIQFRTAPSTVSGSITLTNNGSTTAYVTSSDYRLKENAVAISDGITRLKTLKPYRFNFKSVPDKTVDGFFAHEVTAVPEAIVGDKDEVDSNNNPVYQSMDYAKITPLLTAALQEAITEIETLKTKVAALEGS